MKNERFLRVFWIASAVISMVPLFPLMAQRGGSQAPPEELKTLILPKLELNQSTVSEALKAWTEEAMATLGGDRKVFAFIPMAASRLREVRLTLSLSQVPAVEAFETMIRTINEQSDEWEVVLNEWKGFGAYCEAKEVPEGLMKARKIMLPAFQIRGQKFLDAVKTWSKLVDRHDPEKDGLSWTAMDVRDRFSLGDNIDLDIPATDAVSAIEQICQAANANVEWGVTEFVDGAMQEFDLKLILFEAKPELRQDHDWTSADGSKTLQARFVKLEQGKVTLVLKSNNQTVDVPLESLSTGSQQQAADLAAMAKGL